MSFQIDHKKKIDSLTYQLNNTDELKRSSNGGNTILFLTPPKEEQQYIKLLHEHFDHEAEFIDIGNLLTSFIDSFNDWNEFEEVYRSLNPSSRIFRSDDPETDLFDLIIIAIQKANEKAKIPVLIHTGALYGTGIENQNIMEHNIVMTLNKPLIILYPSILKENDLYFLGFRKANKYRCSLVE